MKIYKLEFKGGYVNKEEMPIISLYDMDTDNFYLEYILMFGIQTFYNSSTLSKIVYIDIDYNNIYTNDRYLEYITYLEYLRLFKRDSVIDGILK